MDLNKAIRKQNKSFKRFLLSMCFIFLLLPLILYLYGEFNNIFYLSYLMLIEGLIIISILIRINREKLEFYYNNNRLRVILGLTNRRLNIACDKIKFVHVENFEDVYGNEDFKIILLSNSKFRSERMIPINKKFLQKYPYIYQFYAKLKKIDPERDYYYTVIKRGGLKKYYLLDAIYRTCVYANFTDETVEKIKELRKEINIDD
ncbi:hypothetical protein [Clostridium niameyense]|uniref:hypothetical protein n=1 Tax=Clostridium niameyense TaxID=1622073 RepID=UPI00067E7D65|nr:hypothetical protein [Clostridium niameyense]